MIKTLQSEFQDLMRDIRELKTAQTKPSTFTTSTKTGTVAAGRYAPATSYFWRIYFEDVGDTNAPIITGDFYGIFWGFMPYNSATNTQDIYYRVEGNEVNYTNQPIHIESSRPINRIEQLTAPGPLQEWTQVRDFYPADMGTTPGWCLQNCRLGFHIYSGTFPNAVSDMLSQRNNGTLHPFNGATETPPDYIACPVYVNISGVADGHVCVWDHGTIWNDGYTVARFTDLGGYIEVWGWGELCDGARVVQHV